jgi:type I restriction enzyme S subunit
VKFERVGKHAKLIRGITFKPDDKCSPDSAGAVVCMRTKNVQSELDTSDLIAVPDQLIRNREKILISGDALVSSANSWNLVGKCCFVQDLDYKATAGGFISILRTTSNALDSRYLYRWFSSDIVQNTVRSFANKTTNISNLDHKRTLDLEIPLPDLAEQKRIAAILDKADGIRRKRREALQLADDFLRSCFLDMFGDPVTSGWVSDTVEGIANKEKGSIRTGPFGSQLLHSEFVDKGIRVLGIDNAVKNEFRIKQDRFISEEKYESLKRYTVHPNDVIITIMGTCGRCAIVPEEIEPAINTKHLCCITLNRKKCLPEYLHAYFLTHPLAKKYLKDRSKGAIMDGLNMGIIKALPVAMPPIQLQQHFVKICKVVNEKKRKLEIASTTCNDLFASLQQRAFKGEL